MRFIVFDRDNNKRIAEYETLADAQNKLDELVEEQEKNGVYLSTKYAVSVEA